MLGYVIVAIHNKIMEGRKWCIKIAQGCTTAGLTDLATFFTELGTGDLIDAEKQAIKWAADMNDPTKRMALLAAGGRRLGAVRRRQRSRRGDEDCRDPAKRRRVEIALHRGPAAKTA